MSIKRIENLDETTARQMEEDVFVTRRQLNKAFRDWRRSLEMPIEIKLVTGKIKKFNSYQEMHEFVNKLVKHYQKTKKMHQDVIYG